MTPICQSTLTPEKSAMLASMHQQLLKSLKPTAEEKEGSLGLLPIQIMFSAQSNAESTQVVIESALEKKMFNSFHVEKVVEKVDVQEVPAE